MPKWTWLERRQSAGGLNRSRGIRSGEAMIASHFVSHASETADRRSDTQAGISISYRPIEANTRLSSATVDRQLCVDGLAGKSIRGRRIDNPLPLDVECQTSDGRAGRLAAVAGVGSTVRVGSDRPEAVGHATEGGRRSLRAICGAAHHSITSSASVSVTGGTRAPMAAAVRWLIVSSNRLRGPSVRTD